MKHHLKLYYFPLSCSFVTRTALEKIGCDYEIELINIMAGEQLKPEYLSINPDGKVPALSINGRVLTENAAILSWLHSEYPEAELFPQTNDSVVKAQQLSDLFWLSSTWHPTGRANMAPFLWTTGEVEPVKEKGRELMRPLLQQLDSTVENQPWYYGEQWSIIDVYFYFGYNLAALSGFDLDDYKNILKHKKSVEDHPAFAASETKGHQALADIGMDPSFRPKAD